MGAFGDADELGRLGQLVMIPGMLAGRLTILPLLLAVAAVQQGYRASSASAFGEATTMSNGRFLPSGRQQSVGQPRCPSVRRRSKVRRCTSWASPSLRSRSDVCRCPRRMGIDEPRHRSVADLRDPRPRRRRPALVGHGAGHRSCPRRLLGGRLDLARRHTRRRRSVPPRRHVRRAGY